MRIMIPGRPWPQMRARHTNTGRAYKHPQQAANENISLVHMRQAVRQEGVIAGPVNIRVVFCFKRPASHFGTGRNENILKDSAPSQHIQKPDLDNLIKHVKDCGTKARLWVDDCQVVFIKASKTWGNVERTELWVEEMVTP